jgi:hypothetical protein
MESSADKRRQQGEPVVPSSHEDDEIDDTDLDDDDLDDDEDVTDADVTEEEAERADGA